MPTSSYANSFYNLIQSKVFSVSNQSKGCFYKTLKYIVPAFGMLAGIPFLKPACDAADNDVGCTFFQAATLISYGLGSVWMISSALEQMAPTTNDEKIVRNHSQAYKVSRHIVANTLSIINTAIPAYISYNFNDNNPFYLCISVPISYAFNAYAFYQLSNVRQHYRYFYNLFQSSRTSSCHQLITNVELLRKKILNMPQTQGDGFYSNLVSRSNDSKAYIDNIILLNLTHVVDIKSKLNKTLRILFQIAFLIFPITNMFVNIKLSKDAVELMTSNETIITLLASLMVCTSTTMDTIFGVRTAGIMYDSLERLVTGSKSNEYLTARKPCLSNIFTITSLIFGGLSSSSRIQIAKKTVGDLFIVICVGVNATIFEWYAQRDLSNRLVKSSVTFFNTGDASLVKSSNQLESLAKIIEFSDHKKLNHIVGLPLLQQVDDSSSEPSPEHDPLYLDRS